MIARAFPRDHGRTGTERLVGDFEAEVHSAVGRRPHGTSPNANVAGALPRKAIVLLPSTLQPAFAVTSPKILARPSTATLTDCPWRPGNGARALTALAAGAGIPGAARVTPHALRHAAITLALDAGVPLHEVQDFAGHRDPRSTRRYDRARGRLDRHASYALAAHLSS